MTLGRLALLLPLVTTLLLWAGVSTHRSRLGMGRLSARGTLVVAFVVLQALLLAITELLSVGHRLTTGWLAAAWALVAAGAAVVAARSGVATAVSGWWRGGGAGRVRRAMTDSPIVVAGLAVLLATGAALVVTAWWYLPNNADSLVYHLTRVAHWAQAGSVAHYATHYTAQLELAPLHELNLLHLHVLAGTDRLDGFVQLAAFAVAVVGVAEIARLLGAAKETQVLAAVIAAATPSLVLEATSTQNNLFAAALGLGLVMMMLAWEPLTRPTAPALLLGLAAGLTVLTKGTTVPLLAPIAAVLGARVAVAEAKATSWSAVGRRVVQVGLVAAVAALLVTGPFVLRNQRLFDSTTGPVTRGTMAEEVAPRWAVANALRNTALHFRIGDGDSGLRTDTSRIVLGGLREAYAWIDPPADDTGFGLSPGQDAFERRDYTEFERNEDYGASPWIIVTLVVTAPIAVVRWRRRAPEATTAALLLLAGGVGFLAFSATTKWTLYGARYQLPLLVLAPALIAVSLAAVHRNLLRGVAVLLLVAGLPSLLDSWARPLLDRRTSTNELEAYIAPRPAGDLPFVTGAEATGLRDAVVATGCTQVGVGGWILVEYLLWAGLDLSL
ncbi:MAG: hypothetical protein ACSLFP_11625, partial [Acidimicrobiales bacterium]